MHLRDDRLRNGFERGRYFGPYLKFSGFDAMAVQGKSKAPVVVYIDGVDWHVEIFEAEGLPDQSHDRTTALTDHFGKGAQKDISVVTTGPAAHHPSSGASISHGTTRNGEGQGSNRPAAGA